ncbi:MAG TPA: UbiA family prenyltransferase [Anaerolineae bacterium]|nr:UbiA family prenyltransferase [Anaerolineae bacterium]
MPGTTLDWKRQVMGVIRLTRHKEYVIFVIVTTFLGARVSGAEIDWRLLLVLVANWLAVGFSFMINDVEDAPDDALNPAKINRNPVSAGQLSLPVAYAASFSVAVLAALAYFFLGPIPFWLGLACLAIGLVYSWRVVRLKSIPVVDLISHGLLLAGLQFLCAYFTFAPNGGGEWIAPFVFVVSISLYGELFNEVRDLEGDLKAGVTHTAALVGERAAHVMMYALLGGAGVSFVYCIVTGLIPVWVLAVLSGLGAILLARPILQIRRGSAMDLTGPLHVPMQIVGAVTMIVWVVAGLFGF